jgi:hypothetical protein
VLVFVGSMAVVLVHEAPRPMTILASSAVVSIVSPFLSADGSTRRMQARRTGLESEKLVYLISRCGATVDGEPIITARTQ